MNPTMITLTVLLIALVVIGGWYADREQKARKVLMDRLREAPDAELATWTNTALAAAQSVLTRKLMPSTLSADERTRLTYQLERVNAAIEAWNAAHEANILQDEKNRQKPTL